MRAKYGSLLLLFRTDSRYHPTSRDVHARLQTICIGGGLFLVASFGQLQECFFTTSSLVSLPGLFSIASGTAILPIIERTCGIDSGHIFMAETIKHT